MNGHLPGPLEHDDDHGRLDPELAKLFDEAASRGTTAGGRFAMAGSPLANSSLTGDAFVTSVLKKMQHARRLRLLRQAAGIALIMVPTAFLAPYVARQTLVVAGLLTEELPATSGVPLTSSIACVCAALIAWRIARRART